MGQAAIASGLIIKKYFADRQKACGALVLFEVAAKGDLGDDPAAVGRGVPR
jgi:hypothetical protein